MLPSRYRQLTKSVIPGGFGAVQKVRDIYLERDVLFKSMKNNTDNDQLLNEIQGLSKARSRHVVEIYDVIKGKGDAIIGVIIELLEGRDYHNFFDEAVGNLKGYLRTIFQIGTALSDLHAVGVTHRDLKLENLKNSSAGVLKLFDFGISVASADYKTMRNRGTQVYAAPELYVDGAAIVPEMDIYSLGICCWALATNALPPELYEMPPQKSARVRSIATVLPELPVEIVKLIDACLDPSPTFRPKSQHFSQIIERHLVRDMHRGIFVEDNKPVFELSHAKRKVTIKIDKRGTLQVIYDGVEFRITLVEGDVYINNRPACFGDVLHEACLLTFGPINQGSNRVWVTFSSSHPRMIL